MYAVSPKILEEIEQGLIRKTNNWASGVCCGDGFDLETGRWLGQGHTACHSWVSSSFGAIYREDNRSYYGWPLGKAIPKDGKHFIIANCFPVKRTISVTKEDAKFFITWLAQKSPFSQFVLNRDRPSLFTGGMMLLCGPTGLNAAQALWMCKATRILTEGSQGAHIFRYLVEGGVDPMLAFYVCSLVKTVKGAVFGYVGIESHSSVLQEYDGSKADLRGMMERKVEPKATTTSRVFGSTSYQYMNKVSGFCKPIVKDDGWGGQTKVTGGSAPEFLAAVLKWQEEEFKDVAVRWEDIKLPEDTPTPEPTRDTVYLEVDM